MRHRGWLLVAILALAMPAASLSAAVPELPQGQHVNDDERPRSPWPAREEIRGELRISISPIRTILRRARSPMPTGFRDGTVLVSGGTRTTGAQTIRSEDRGHSWRAQQQQISHLNTLELSDGRLLVMDYNPRPLPGRPGFYRAARWISNDKGRTLLDAPPLVLDLPADEFDPNLVHWFHGNLVQMPGGEIMTVMQGEEVVDGKSTWRCFLVRSADDGENWEFVSIVADHQSLAPIRPALERHGWRLHGAVEPALIHLGSGRLVCIARTVDDESNVPESQYGEVGETYHDLNYTVSGNGIHTSMTELPAERYYAPGPPSAPLIIMQSDDGGETWSAPEPMRQARGCFPRMALSEGILALTYGGVAVPRWGNFISFSLDGGRTWTGEINLAPFLTTGYTGIIETGRGRFLVFFDCTPPQPWTQHESHWIGVVDVEVKP